MKHGCAAGQCACQQTGASSAAQTSKALSFRHLLLPVGLPFATLILTTLVIRDFGWSLQAGLGLFLLNLGLATGIVILVTRWRKTPLSEPH